MDPQIRNFRDFLQLYNKITELCFSHCADNFFNRNISQEETACLDKCVHKFTRVNQRIMNVYVEVQTTINERRLAELETIQAQQTQQEQQPLATTQSDPIPTNLVQDLTAVSPATTKLPQDTENAVR